MTRRPTFTKTDWDIILKAMVYHEAAAFGSEEFGEDNVPEGFRSWREYYRRADRTIGKVATMYRRTAAA